MSGSLSLFSNDSSLNGCGVRCLFRGSFEDIVGKAGIAYNNETVKVVIIKPYWTPIWLVILELFV